MGFFVEDEIASQPDCWRTVVERVGELGASLAVPGERTALIGCGTSWFVAQVVARWRESHGLGESDAFTASEFPVQRGYDRVIAITRSGTTTEVIDVLAAVKGKIPTVALTGDLDTPVVGAADECVDLSFADERSVVQTRFATSAMILFWAAFEESAEPVIAQAEEALVAPIAESWLAADQITFLGQGWRVGIAHEAALKVRETSASWAESYAAMEYRHGPISVARPGRVVWSFGPPPAGLADQVSRTGAEFVLHDRHPLAELVLAQRLAVARARGLGLDPDNPGNLTRSIILAE